jgi:hypothetical protein
MICTSIYVKSVLRYTFLILDTNHPDNLHLREQVCEDPWLFLEAKWGPRARSLGNTVPDEGNVYGHQEIPLTQIRMEGGGGGGESKAGNVMQRWGNQFCCGNAPIQR